MKFSKSLLVAFCLSAFALSNAACDNKKEEKKEEKKTETKTETKTTTEEKKP